MTARSFRDVFGVDPEATATAPGRVNMLGEHTDYNDGYVLPTPIPRVTTVEVAPSPDAGHHLYAAQLDAAVDYAPGAELPQGFAPYVLGCLLVLAEHGHDSGPLCVRIDSEVPIGAGLSSSAALEVAVLRAVRSLRALPIDDVELALMAQQAEIRYAGVRVGIMDQMAASLAQPGEMLFLDTRTLERALLPFPAGSEFLVIDSGIPRSLAGSAYNQRREECEAAAAALGIPALRDVAGLAAIEQLPEPLKRRARHVYTENARVLEASRGVSAARFGELMNASHASLRDDFEVSVAGLDALVELLAAHADVFGARLTGAGFGGACVALVAAGRQQAVADAVLAAYSGAARWLV